MLRSHRTARTKSKSKTKRSTRDDGVIEPDTRIVFGVLAIGMLVGAMMTTPSKDAKADTPITHVANDR